MIVLKRGSIYKSEGSQGFSLDLIFSHRDKDKNFVKGLVNEDLLRILIDRMSYQNEQSRDGDTFGAILHLRQALQMLDVRNDKKLKLRTNTAFNTGIKQELKDEKLIQNEPINSGDGIPVQSGSRETGQSESSNS